MNDYLGRLRACMESEVQPGTDFWIEESRVRLSDRARERYAPRFALAGIDIDSVQTADELADALERSWSLESIAVVDALEEQPAGDSLERDLLIAVARGEQAKVEAMESILRARRNSINREGDDA